MDRKLLYGGVGVIVLAVLGYAVTKNVLVLVLVLVAGVAAFVLLRDRLGIGGGAAEVEDEEEERPRRTRSRRPAEPTAPAGADAGGLPTWSPPAGADAGPIEFDSGSDLFAGSEESDLEDTWGEWETTESAEPESWDAEADLFTTDSGGDDLFTTEDTAGADLFTTDSGGDDLFTTEDTAGADLFTTDSAEETYESSFDESGFDEGGFEAETFEEPASSGGGGLFSVPAPINEAVSSADDIMAASAATELHVEDEDAGEEADGELAKLLAKVQARLAAYE